MQDFLGAIIDRQTELPQITLGKVWKPYYSLPSLHKHSLPNNRQIKVET